MMMDKKLKAMFDFQDFDGNYDLQQVINQVHARYSMKQNVQELSLDEMGFATAAGMQRANQDKNQKPWD